MHIKDLAGCLLATTPLLTATAIASEAADTPEQLDNVVVLSALRVTPSDEMPASVTVIDSRTLQMAGSHLADVMQLAPNLGAAGGTARPRYFQIRGIGETSNYEGAPNPSVGFLVDDIDFSGIGSIASLFDVEQVEVLHGPQGAIYGANALAGLISVRTRDPSDIAEMIGEVTVGDYGQRSVAVAGGTPFSGGAWRLAAQRNKGDGYRDNAFLGRDDTDGYDESMLRGKLRFDLGEQSTLLLAGLYADYDNGYDAWALDSGRTTITDTPGSDTQRSRALSARFDTSAIEAFDLRMLASYAGTDLRYTFDGDWANPGHWGFPYGFLRDEARERETWSGEVRLTSRGDGPTGWALGAYALRLEEDYRLRAYFNGNPASSLDSAFSATNVAAYGQWDAALGRRLRLTTGARIEHRSTDYADSRNVSASPSHRMYGGNVSLSFEASDTTRYYGTLSRGYKAGAFNVGAAVPESHRLYGPEYLWNAELGAQMTSADRRLSASGVLFHMWRRDQQVSTGVQLDPTDPLSFIFITDNAARGRNYGFEGDLRYRFADAWQVGANLSLLRTPFDEYGDRTAELKGRAQAHSPQHRFALSMEYLQRQETGPFARIDVQQTAGFYYDVAHNLRAPSRTLVNLRAGYAFSGNVRVSAWVRNLFDEDYTLHGNHFGLEPPDFSPRLYEQLGEPRRVGVTLDVAF